MVGKGNGDGSKGLGQGPTSGSSGSRSVGLGGGAKAAGGAREPAAMSKGSWTRPPTQTDAEGYTLVQPRRVWQQDAALGGRVDEGRPLQNPAPQSTSRPRWSEEQSDDDEMYAEDDLAEAEGDQDDHVETAAEDKSDPRRLRTRYEALARAVRDWERRNPGAQDDPALHTLREARDGAEEDWRRAKSPAPLPTRMGWAQVKLDRAGAALTRARQAVDRFDEWAESHRADLVRQMEEADRWYRWRQQQLEDLHNEAGARTGGRARGGEAIPARNAAVSERLVGELLPEVHALLEHVQGNPEIEERLNSIAAGLQSAGQELGNTGAGAAECFDIGTGDAGDAWDHRWDDECAHDDGMQMGGAADDRDGARMGWRPEGAGRWSKAKTGQEGDAPASGRCTGNGTSHDTTPGTGALSTTAAGLAEGATGSTGSSNKRGAEETADTNNAVRQRTDAEAREEADRRRAAELLQQQQQAIAAQRASHEAGAGGFGSEAAQAAAAHQFVAEVCKAVGRARKVGVDPRADGKELVELSPTALKQWVADKLGDESTWN